MPIPSEILAVNRPVNTVVVAYGKNKNHYSVRQRTGCRNVGGRHLPVTGETIGHILDGRFVPLSVNSSVSLSSLQPDLKDWANFAACEKVSSSLLADLREIYGERDALRIYCIAILRVCNAGISDSELKEAYECSFLSETHPDVPLSKNTVSEFLRNLGKSCSRIVEFMRRRAALMGLDHHLLLDGTLKTNESNVNSLSEYSRKAAKKGGREISVLYAFDLDRMEPVCSKCFPGNMLDLTAYENFLSENGLTKGIIVADKGFPSSVAETHFQKHPDLHYLNPLKRNSKMADVHEMRTMTGILPNCEGITYRKEKCTGRNKWLYSFRDSHKAATEEMGWLARAKANEEYSHADFLEHQGKFGTIVLESDLDMEPATAYKAYSQRWEIEIVMRYYKTACEFDDTRVQDDYSVIGSEFCNFLATVVTFRLISAFDQAGFFERKTYGKIMQLLQRAKKIKLPGEDWRLIKINPSLEEVLKTLELIPKEEEPPKKRRGRPRKIRV